jgi:Ca-activated chloride channel family protein
MRRPSRLLAAAAGGLLFPASVGFAAGVLRSQGGDLAIESQTVRVQIEGPVATTEVEQVFRNAAPIPAEAILDFPLPPRGTLSGLSIWVDGKEVQGEVVARTRAEDVYSEVTGVTVRRPEEGASQPGKLGSGARPLATRETAFSPSIPRRRDPGLLELNSGRELRLRVAPVPACGTQRVRVRYVEPVPVENGQGRYTVDLARRTTGVAPAKLSCEVFLAGRFDSVQCPSHRGADVSVLAAGSAYKVSLAEERSALDKDLEVSFALTPASAPCLSVQATRGADGHGTALLTVTPWLPADPTSRARDVVFVLDSSASMGEHRKAATAVLESALARLAPEDRFEVIAFNLAGRACHGKLEKATPPAVVKARTFLEAARFEQVADARTAFASLARSVAATPGARPVDLVLVTDSGFSDQDELVRTVETQARASGLRVFALELGRERTAEAPLARIARRTGGAAFASTDAGAAAAGRDLVASLAVPVLRAPSLTIEGVTLEARHPEEAPLLLRAGTPVSFVGHYESPGRGRAILAGTLPDGRRVGWTLPFELPARGDYHDVARLWAQAAADDVLDRLAPRNLDPAARAGLEKELARVSLEGQILTRATSLLVLESEGMFQDHGIERVNKERVGAERDAEARRREELERAIEEKRRAEEATPTLAMAATPVVWQAPRIGLGGLGHGGGAGEPVFLVLGAASAACALARRRLAA